MLVVACGSPAPTASRALRAAICTAVACFGAASSPQKPRALMISAGVCGLGSALSAEGCSAGFAFGAETICVSAEANCRFAAACGFARGVGIGSADLAGAAAAIVTAAALSFF